MQEVYLDNSATTRPLPGVIKQINRVLTGNFGNPSSLHNKGLAAEKVLKSTRRSIAEKLGIDSGEVYFTSGGTESNNLAIQGIAARFQHRGRHLITTSIEHASVLETFQALGRAGYEVTYLQPDKQGKITAESLRQAVREDTILVSIIHVNNELGTINPIQSFGPLIKQLNHKTFLHVDGVQSLGKILLNPTDWQIDLLTLSAHKIHGPKGTGALYIKQGIELEPLFYGGGQERGIRSGTENVPGIAGFGPAVEALPELTASLPRSGKLDRLRRYFLNLITEKIPEAVVNSPRDGAPHIVSLSFPGLKGEVLVHSLEGEGIFVSTGSACHSRSDQQSHVLNEIGLSPELAEGTIRVSFSRFNTEDELDYTVDRLAHLLKFFF